MDGVKVDDREVLNALDSLDSKKMNKAYKEALKKSMQPIEKQAKMNLRKSGIKNVTKKYISPKTGKTYPSMQSGIKTSVDVRKPGEEWAKTHIMKEFRLKFFEMGTALRKTKKGSSRGSISAKWFFKQAIAEKSKECQDILEDNIRQSILRAYNK